MKLDLGDERRTDHDRARQEHDEDRRSVTGIDKLIIEPARIAARPQCQKALKQLALAAARAGAGQARDNSGGKGLWRVVSHGRTVHFRLSPRKRVPAPSIPDCAGMDEI